MKFVAVFGLLVLGGAVAEKGDAAQDGAVGTVNLANLSDTIQSLFGDSGAPGAPPPLAGDSVIAAAVAAGEKVLSSKSAPAKVPVKTQALVSTAMKVESMDEFLGVAKPADAPLAEATTARKLTAKTAVKAIASDAKGKEAAEKKAKEEAEKRAAEKKAADKKAKDAAEKKAKEEADKKAAVRKAAEKKAKDASERKAKQEAKNHIVEKKAKEAIEKKAKEEAKQKEAEKKAADEKAKDAMERKAKEEADKKAAAKKAKEAAEKKAREEADKKAAEKKAKEAAEKKAKEEAEKKAADNKAAERKDKEAASKEAKEEAEKKANEEAEKKATEEKKAKATAEKKVKEDVQKKAEEEADKKAADEKAKEAADKKPKEKTEKKPNEEAAKTDTEQITAVRLDAKAKNAVLKAEVAMLKAAEPVEVTVQKALVKTEEDKPEKKVIAEEVPQPQAKPQPKVRMTLASFYTGHARRQQHKQARLDISGDDSMDTHIKGTLFTLFGVKAAAPEAPAPTAETPKKVAFLEKTRTKKQYYEETARAAKEDGMYDIQITDPWGELEKADSLEVKRVSREDVAARMEAKVVTKPREASKEEKEARGGVHASNVWASLEQEDGDIEQSLQNSEDLREYDKLSKKQDEHMEKLGIQQQAADAMVQAPRPPLKHNDLESKAMHDTFESLEKKDQKEEDQVRRNPDLQMLQIIRPH